MFVFWLGGLGFLNSLIWHRVIIRTFDSFAKVNPNTYDPGQSESQSADQILSNSQSHTRALSTIPTALTRIAEAEDPALYTDLKLIPAVIDADNEVDPEV